MNSYQNGAGLSAQMSDLQPEGNAGQSSIPGRVALASATASWPETADSPRRPPARFW